MDTEKFNKVLDYFSNSNIQLPTDVKNSIEDVFRENDNIEDVQCYHKDELDDFQKDLKLSRDITIYVNGSSKGYDIAPFTYYGQIDFSLSEHLVLIEKDQKGNESVKSELVNIDNSDIPSLVFDPKEYQIILLETTSWNSPDPFQIHDRLFIYCPEENKEIDVNE